MNDDTQRQTLRIDQRMNFAPLHFLARVIPGQTVMTAPFPTDFKDWLSMIAAEALASRPMTSRKSICNRSQIASQVPAFWKLRKIL